jgi:hypothetical protein
MSDYLSTHVSYKIDCDPKPIIPSFHYSCCIVYWHSQISLTWPRGPGFSGLNKEMYREVVASFSLASRPNCMIASSLKLLLTFHTEENSCALSIKGTPGNSICERLK